MYIVVKIEEFKYRGVQSMKGMYILHLGDESQLRTPIMLQWTGYRAGSDGGSHYNGDKCNEMKPSSIAADDCCGAQGVI